MGFDYITQYLKSSLSSSFLLFFSNYVLLSHYLCLSRTVSPCFRLSLTLSLSLSHFLSASLPFPSVSLSHLLSFLPIFLSFYLCLSLFSLSLPPFSFLSRSHSLSLSLTLFFSLYLPLSLSIYLPLSLSLSLLR